MEQLKTNQTFGIDLSEQTSPDWADLSENHDMLWNFLSSSNGFSLFEDALIFFPSIKSTSPWHTIEDISHHMDELDFLQGKALTPFATDSFGFLFLMASDGIYHMETEDAKLEYVAENMNDFLLKLAENGDYWSAVAFKKEWETQNSLITPLAAGERLVAKQPFIFGGAFEASNLKNQTFEEILSWYASLHNQLKDVEDGTVIQITQPITE